MPPIDLSPDPIHSTLNALVETEQIASVGIAARVTISPMVNLELSARDMRNAKALRAAIVRSVAERLSGMSDEELLREVDLVEVQSVYDNDESARIPGNLCELAVQACRKAGVTFRDPDGDDDHGWKWEHRSGAYGDLDFETQELAALHAAIELKLPLQQQEVQRPRGRR